MTTISKENIKTLRALQELVRNGTKIDEKTLTGIGIDTTNKLQDYRNIRITSDFWNGVKVSVIDDTKDLDGIPIRENKKLILRVKNLYENGIDRILFSELQNLNIWTPAKEIILGNIRLKNYSDGLFFSYDYYKIEIIDSNKSIDGLWLDPAISRGKILDVLHDFNLSEKEFIKMKELDLNKALEQHFKKYFETVKKGRTSKQGLIDLVVGANHDYGIELKMAKELQKAANRQKAIGQIEEYTREFKDNFLLIIAGRSNEKNDKAVQDVFKKVKECKGYPYYLEAF
jgi:hypothetical protein